MTRAIRVALQATALVCAVVTHAEAQRDTAVPIQFDFINPGARSLGLGGAFTAIVDDATASVTNPAGLVQRTRDELTLEGRSWRYVTPYVRGGRDSGVQTNRGIDTQSTLDIDNTRRTVVGPSFISYVHPWPKQGVALAVYRQEVSRLRARAQSQGFFFVRQADPTDRRELPFQVDRQIDVVNYGVSVGVPLSKSFAIGGGIQASNLAMFSLLRGYEYPAPGGTRDLYASADYRELLYEGHQIADDWGAAFNVGVFWTPSTRVRAGASFRRAASFSFDGGFRYPQRLDQETGTNRDYTGTFRVPDTTTVGIGVRPVPELWVSAELTHVRYSQLVTFIRDTVTFASADPLLYRVPNSTELHVGLEYTLLRAPSFLRSVNPRLRFGVWRDPDHALTYGGTNEVWRVLPPGSTLMHWAIGGGIEFTNGIRLDAGADFSSGPRVVSVAVVVPFGS